MPIRDERLGFATHFDQQGSSPWWIPSVMMPLIAQTNAAYIRDDWNWSQGEPTQGNYILYPPKQIWIEAAKQYGLKVVAILNFPPKFYTDPYDPVAAANYCKFLVQAQEANGTPLAAIEVTNEPNNTYKSIEGANWQTMLVTLTNSIYNAVHSVSSTCQVIGLGAQGSQILSMLPTTTMDGVVYHPYDSSNNVPETAFEPPVLNYAQWVATVRAATPLPIWETERNCDTGPSSQGEYIPAVWNARRFLQSFGLGVDHTFLYDFSDSSNQSVLDNHYNKRQAWYVLERIMSVLVGLTTTGTGVTLVPGASDFDLTDFISYVFAGPNSTVAASWLGNHSPAAPPAPCSGTVTFTVLNPITPKACVIDVVRGVTLPLTTYRTSLIGTSLSVFGFPITDTPRLIVAQ